MNELVVEPRATTASDRNLAFLLLGGGFLGLVASFVLVVEKIALIVDHLRYLPRVRAAAEQIVAQDPEVTVTTWRERNPALAAMIDMDSGNGMVTMFIICLLVTLGVVNATLMSLLERTRRPIPQARSPVAPCRATPSP